MSIKFKDVAHYYVGCKIQTTVGIEILDTATLHGLSEFNLWGNVKPILKPLPKINLGDELEVTGIDAPSPSHLRNALQTKRLIEIGYDVFGLIEANEAVSIK